MTKKYYPEIDILKGIAIFLVVLGHAITVYPVNLHNVKATSLIFEWVESVHMPLFFLVSGFTFSYHEGYWKKKAKRILVPYLFFCFLDIAARTLLPALVNREKSLAENLYDVVFGGGGYWFLYVLLIFYLVFPVLSLLQKRFDPLKYPCFVLAFLIPFIPGIPEIFLLKLTAHYFPYFYLGWRIRENKELLAKYRPEGKGALLPMGIALALWTVFKLINGTAIYTPFYILGALSGSAFFFFFVSADLTKPLEGPLKEWGVYSLQIYLLDSYLLVISRTIICRFLGEPEALLIMLFNLVFDLGGAVLIIRHIILRSKILRILCGAAN